jgi:hypothetical protein
MRRESVGERRRPRGWAAIKTRVAAETRVGARVNQNPTVISAFILSFSDVP